MIVSYCHHLGVAIDGVRTGALDLFTTCTHHSELQLITPLLLIFTVIYLIQIIMYLSTYVSM
jgi:hypothetical protein